MKALVSTPNQTLVESVQFALEAEGIDAAIIGGSGPLTPFTVLVDDGDFDRARTVLETVRTSFGTAPRRAPRLARLLRFGLLLAVILYVALRIVFVRRTGSIFW